jgi:hypothetical protein
VAALVTQVYDLSGRSSLEYDGQDPAVATYLAAQMDPFAPCTRNAVPGVVIETMRRNGRRLVDVQNPARDGLTTASDGERAYVLAHGRACAVPWPLDRRPLHFAPEPGFPLSKVFSRLVRPALHLSLHERECVAVHSAAVELEGGAVLVAGWSESGKTETALALMEQGARFLSDKWTVAGTDGHASSFPINVGVRRWVLPYLPRLAGAVPARARAQLTVAGVVAAATKPARDRMGRPGAFAERVVAVADRVALAPSELRAAYGQTDDPGRRVPLLATAVLTTVASSEPTCEPADPAWAAAKLARTAAYERRELFELALRRGYAFPLEAADGLRATVERETALLERALARGRVLEVRAPFPVDPTRVADALLRAL